MAKQLKYSQEARNLLLEGISELSKAVGTTLGPKGRNVAIDKKWGAPNVIHDGVTVAKEIELEDPFKNMGAQLIKEAASKTNDIAGDGTTTATVLAEAIVSEGIKNITAGANPMILKKGIERGVDIVIEYLNSDKVKHEVKKGDIRKVATISAQDEKIGTLIAEALNKVGKDGIVTVEEGRGLEFSIDYKEGMEFDKGYASAYFVTNADRMESEIDDAYILITDKKVSSLQELLPFLENFVKVSKNLVIIADDIEGEALATLVVNKLRGTFNILAVKAPGFGDRRKALLEDIAILTGGTVISEDTGRKLESVTIEDCGKAEKVKSTNESTQIIGGKGGSAEVKSRVAQIKKELDRATSEFDREKLQERLAKLSGGAAIINVGAATEIELKDKKERVIDAIAATKAAIEEGIVAGGEITLFDVAQEINNKHLENAKAGDDVLTGLMIFKTALERPFKKLMENAGYNGDTMADKVRAITAHGMGIDVMSDSQEPVNMIEKGIIDPVKVVKTAVQSAASVAMMVLTTEALITDIPEKDKTPMGGGGMPGMGGMDY